MKFAHSLPSGGTPRKIGAVIGGTNPYGVDLVASSMIGIKPSQVYTISDSIQRGLCPNELSKVNIIGDPFEDFVIHDFKMPAGRSITFLDGFPAWLQKRVNNWVSPRPVFIHNLCIGCKECEQCCPPKAIHMVNNRPYVDMNKCIKCFCCQELCPKKAVEIKRSGLVQKFLR